MKHLLTIGLLAGCTLTPPAGTDTFGLPPGATSGPGEDGEDGEDEGDGSSSSGATSVPTGGSTAAGASTSGGTTAGGSTSAASTAGVLDSGGSTDSTDSTDSTESSSTGEPVVSEAWPEFAATCSSGQLSTHFGDALGDPELIIVGVYEPTNTEIDVVLDRAGPGIVLVLSSYHSVHWVLDVAGGTNLQAVVLNGFNQHTVEGEGAAMVTDRSGPGNYIEACGYVYPDDGGGCYIDDLISGAESLAGADLTGFAGCYEASSFTVE